VKLQRQLSNGAWVDDERVEHFLGLVLAREPQYARYYRREPMTTQQELIDFLATGKTLDYDTDWYAQIRDGEVYERREAEAKQRRANNPNFSNQGWLMDCGHRVHFKAEIMQASHGTSCQDCYDKMSD
jgi:hypothetical protein